MRELASIRLSCRFTALLSFLSYSALRNRDNHFFKWLWQKASFSQLYWRIHLQNPLLEAVAGPECAALHEKYHSFKKICYCYSAVLHFPEHKQYLSRTFFVGRGMGKNVRQRVTAWQANNSKFSKVIKIKQDTERTLYTSCKIFQLLHSSSKSEWSSLK